MKPLSNVAVVIPAYRVRLHVLSVIEKIGPEVTKIYVVDDACPEFSGKLVEQESKDNRITVFYNQANLGVGGAVMVGYRAALADGCEIVVKLDGDGQMNSALISKLLLPIQNGEADYSKGNRFFDLVEINKMPKLRIFGNAFLSIMTKFSSGYWNIFDPTNGFTAIHADALRKLPLNKVSQRYFFESDMLFRLNTIRAVVVDVPMDAVYGEEVSNLKVRRIAVEFFYKNVRNYLKRIFYNYYLRDVSIASLELPVGLCSLIFGIIFGSYHWYLSIKTGIVATTGTVLIAAMSVMMGIHLIMAFLNYDVSMIPKVPFQRNK